MDQKMIFMGDYVNGKFVRPSKPDMEWSLSSPADLAYKYADCASKLSHVDEAIESANKAFLTWSTLSQQDRNKYLLKLKSVFEDQKQKLAEIISIETGKPLWDSLGEAQAMIGKITITLEESLKLVADQFVPNALPGIDGVTKFKPRGVFVVIGPFNFPGHLANGHIIPALATGNTVVFKPSELTPMTGQFMAECYDKAEIPAGVFNLVQGQAETGRRLSMHENVEGILFTGSYDVGLKIKQDTMTHFWKILALEMGGKNASIVWKDADFEKALFENLMGSFMTTGQRCSCTSRLLLHESIYDRFVSEFHEKTKKLKIGHWRENPFMGPLISAKSVENYVRFQGIAVREGAECLMRGKVLERSPAGNYVSPSINLVNKPNPNSVYQKTEIFGPNVAVYKISDFDEALTLVNSSSYGLVCSVFSKDKSLLERAQQKARVGLVNWNRSTAGASSRLPFGGMGKSGNDRPSAHFAVNYCTVPVASLLDTSGFDETKIPAGVDW